MAVPPRYHEIQYNVRSYTVGWFAPLPCERAAAEALRDEAHGPPTDFQRAPDDNLVYSWGKIGDHNFVLASLEAGTDGQVAAAQTATRMLASFPGIRFSLLVGIGGAIPRFNREGDVCRLRRNPDVRLGDIVVSQPNGNGGVIQYDHYKATKDGPQVKGSLNRPPPALLYGLSALQAKHEQNPSVVPNIIADLEKTNGYMVNKRGYKYPGQKKDRLFYPSYAHPEGDLDCEDCSAQHEVERNPRETPDPEVHYGTIASGNVVVKNAEDRENLIQHHPSASKCLCYEMEAAGLMNNFPCLVIRGICDYSDSHKNDVWHKYAALVAAAFAKELLLNMARDTVEEAVMAKDWMKNRVNMIAYHTMKNEIEKTLKTPNTYSKSAEIKSTLQSVNLDINEAGQWFLDSSEFQNWRNSYGSLLWVYGSPGSGKTVLSASVINYLQSNLVPENVSKVVLHHYFDFQELKKGENLRPLGCMLRSFLIQLSRTHDYMLEDLYKRLQAFQDDLCESQLEELLFQMTRLHGNVKIVIDALDEMENTQRETVCGWITKTLKEHPNRFSFLVTSRREGDIEDQLHPKCKSLEMSAGCDIEKYVLARIKEYQLNKGQRWSEKSLRKIQDVLLGRVNGMFRWVVCQLDQLLDHPQTESIGDDEIDEVLRTLPQDLTDTYDQILERIPKQKRDAAYRLLQILLFCKRPIRVLEANEFLSVTCSGFNVSKRIKHPREVTHYCSSLVTLRGSYSKDSVGRLTEIVLAHSSVRDYLLFNHTLGEGQVNMFGQLEANKAIFKTCLQYIHFLSMRATNPYNPKLRYRFQLTPYATSYLFAHASAASEDEETVNAVAAFCQNEDVLRIWAWHGPNRIAWIFCPKGIDHASTKNALRSSALYNAAYYGLKDSLQICLERELYSICKITSAYAPLGFWKIGDESPTDNTPLQTYQSISLLYAAAEAGRGDVVRMLIEAGFTVDEVGGPQGTALDIGCANGCVGVVEALLEKAKQRSTSTMWFEGALRQVVRTGSSQLVQVFLNHGLLTHSAHPSIESAIFDAALYGNTAVVQELLRHCRGLRNLTDLSPPLSPSYLGWLSAWIPDVFSSREHSDAKPLESYNIELDPRSKKRHFANLNLSGEPVDRAHLFSTALQAAAFEDHDEIVEALLKDGRDPNATGGFFGTALQAAAAGGSPRVVQRLLDAGADPNTTGGYFGTALQAAAAGGSRKVVQRLLDAGADPNTTGGFLKTALNTSLTVGSWIKEGWSPALYIRWLWCQSMGRHTDQRMDQHAKIFYRFSFYSEIAIMLLKAGARPLRGGEEMACALKLGSQEVALNIIENAVSGSRQAEGNFHTVATLLRGKDAALLHDAISQGFSRVVESMIRNGAEIDVPDSCGRTPLHNAMQQSNQDIALMVIEAVAQRPDAASLLKVRDSSGMTALHYAAQLLVSSKTTKHLLDAAKQEGTLIECLAARNMSGKTALLCVPPRYSRISSRMRQLLIEEAASAGILEGYVIIQFDRDKTTLHSAARFNVARGITLLLQTTTDWEVMNLDKQNFVDCAREESGVERLFDVCPMATFCSSMEEARALAFETLLRELNNDAMKELARQATFHCSFLDIPDADCGMKLLQQAAEKGFAAMVEQLLDLGAQPENVDKKKMTPLHRAAKSGYLEMVSAVFQRIRNEERENRPLSSVADFREDDVNGFLTGRPSNRQDTSGNTLLRYGDRNENVEIVENLVDRGATMHKRNKEGNTPLDIAQGKREAFYVAKIQMPRDIPAVTSLLAKYFWRGRKRYDDDFKA